MFQKLLGITKQQSDILHSILVLQSQNTTTTPVNIEKYYVDNYKESIQRSNLFGQLKALRNSELITKTRDSNYYINVEGVKASMKEREDNLIKDLETIRNFQSNLEDEFRKLSIKTEEPMTDHFPVNELYQKVLSPIKRSNKVLITSFFPGIVFPFSLYNPLKRNDYYQLLQRRCFNEKSLEVVYLTQLEVDRMVRYTTEVFKDKNIAYSECVKIIELFEHAITQHDDTFKVFLTESQNLLHVIIPITPELNESFIVLRSDTDKAYGGIYMRNQNSTGILHNQFNDYCQQSVQITKKNVRKYVTSLKKKLKIMFGKENPAK